jgi:hypothetical protein
MSDDLEPAVLVDVGDAIAAELNAALEEGEVFQGLQFTAEAGYADFKPEDLDDLDCLKVDVIIAGHDENDLDDRESVGYMCAYDVVVRKKFGERETEQSRRIDKAEIDRLVLFIEEIDQYFATRGFASGDWVDSKIRVTVSAYHLREMRLFLGVVRVRVFASVEL